MELGYRILVYHVNSSRQITTTVQSFVSGYNRLYVSEEDGYWAGAGMYFWDNVGNVVYWQRDRENKGIETAVLSATLLLSEDNVLDLTDDNIVKLYKKLWPIVAKKYRVSEKCSPGKKSTLYVERCQVLRS
ncbi:hypothetical protein LFAB_10845 [Lactiplantibacillus fabifermentans T30PCM01]|uniref:Uncharacterized protein n=2 Tax=Lactiplantibacillus fabifermentans TaxID=483011 RepID=W6T6M8_9LACO|nr:hypothetical protein LFAB_10845 [Lactiplantibacillus fabifermentans T30PCM01]